MKASERLESIARALRLNLVEYHLTPSLKAVSLSGPYGGLVDRPEGTWWLIQRAYTEEHDAARAVPAREDACAELVHQLYTALVQGLSGTEEVSEEAR